MESFHVFIRITTYSDILTCNLAPMTSCFHVLGFQLTVGNPRYCAFYAVLVTIWAVITLVICVLYYCPMREIFLWNGNGMERDWKRLGIQCCAWTRHSCRVVNVMSTNKHTCIGFQLYCRPCVLIINIQFSSPCDINHDNGEGRKLHNRGIPSTVMTAEFRIWVLI